MLTSLKIEKDPIFSQTQLLEELLGARGPGCFTPLTVVWPLCLGSVVLCLQVKGRGQLVSYHLIEVTSFCTE